MNSIAIIIILMISLIGIGSIFWIRNYYNVNTRTVDTILLKKSFTNILASKPEEEYENSNYTPSSLDNVSEDEGYSDGFTRFNDKSSIRGSISNIFNSDNNDESKLKSFKTAINKSIKKEDKDSNTITPIRYDESITPTFVNSEEEIVPYTQESETNSNIEKPPIFPKSEENKDVESETTEEGDSGVIYTEQALQNKKFVSPEDEVQEAINKSEPEEDDSGVITPIHTRENREILELYDDEETMTPYENFERKDSDQIKIENASHKIDKFYEKLSEISIGKITGKGKENKTSEDESLNKHDNNYTQTVFKTEGENNKLSNETIVPNEPTVNPDDDDTITPVTSSKRTPDRRVGFKIKVKLNNVDVELKAGDTVIFNYNNESYSSNILDVRPDEVYVTYRRQHVWISPDTIKKKLE